ncbi:unnamed protein product [Brassica rapa subsp. trilocularis]
MSEDRGWKINSRSSFDLLERMLKIWFLHGNNTNPEVLEKGFLGNVVVRSTASQTRTMSPVWNEDMMFVMVEPFEDLEDKLGQKEECLGKCEIKLSQVETRVLPGPVLPIWYNLVGDSRGFAGRLHLRVSLDGGYHVLDESTQV